MSTALDADGRVEKRRIGVHTCKQLQCTETPALIVWTKHLRVFMHKNQVD